MFIQIIILFVFGAIWYYFHKQRTAEEKTAVMPPQGRAKTHPTDSRDWAAIVAKAAELVKMQEKPCIALAIADGVVGANAHSSIGGCPSLPKGAAWPTDETGKAMVFLVQLNFADLPKLDGYPDTGVLSFFVKDEDVQGCEFPSIGNQGCAVLYYPDPDGLERHPLPDQQAEYVPMSLILATEGRPLQGHTAMGPLTNNGMEVTELTKGWYPDCPRNLWDTFGDDLLNAKPSQLYFGGHPDFIQYDIRSPTATPDYTAYTEVLLQMGFIHSKNREIEVCWGDAGEACFLITKEDLAACRFDRVAYNWDCG